MLQDHHLAPQLRPTGDKGLRSALLRSPRQDPLRQAILLCRLAFQHRQLVHLLDFSMGFENLSSTLMAQYSMVT
jgi:hypothetical protein